jgi:heme-degrading monooxygenase HmoA
VTRVTSILELPVEAEQAAELVRSFHELEVFAHARRTPGFRSAVLLRPLQAGDPFVVVAEWDDETAYGRWLAAPVRERLGEQMADLIAGEMRSRTYAAEIVERA